MGNKLVPASPTQQTICEQLAIKEQSATVRILNVTDPATKRQKTDNVTGDLVVFGDDEVRQPVHSVSGAFPTPVLPNGEGKVKCIKILNQDFFIRFIF